MSGVRVARLLAASAMALSLAACSDSRATDETALSVSVEQASAWTRNFNPLVPGGLARWPTRAGIYEPLAIHNAMTGEWVPWLAKSWRWSDDLTRLVFHVRAGVTWSDGAPLTARDVAFTFQLMREHRVLDQQGVWSWLADARAVDAQTVELELERPFVPGFGALAQQVIVPEHIWRHIDEPMQFANPNPVASGPYTEVEVFRDQVYRLGRNPNYWRGQPAVPAIRCVAYPGNDQAHLALIDGQLDWASTFVPAVERTYVARDPEHFHYWFPTAGPSVMLFPNATRGALGDPRVRRALSMAIDRERLAAIAMEGYTRPANGAGLSDGYATWLDPVAASSSWVRRDRVAARRALDEAGLRADSDGVRLRLQLQVVSGWSDWVRAAQLIARDLNEVGIRTEVRTYELATWMSNVQRGEFDLAVGWTLDGPTPYRTYRWLMSSDTVRPVGESSAGNWNRVGDAEADRILDELGRVVDPQREKALLVQLQRRFTEVAPAIPLFPSPLWGTFSTRRFVGFPHAGDPYAVPSPHTEPASLLVLTRLRPREDR